MKNRMVDLINGEYDSLREELLWFDDYFKCSLARMKNRPMTNIKEVACKRLNKMGLTLSDISDILRMKSHSSVIHLLRNRDNDDIQYYIDNFDRIISMKLYPIVFLDEIVWARDYKLKEKENER